MFLYLFLNINKFHTQNKKQISFLVFLEFQNFYFVKTENAVQTENAVETETAAETDTAVETKDEISKIEAEEHNFLNRTQYFILMLNTLSIYKDDSCYNASIDCFFEQLIATKVLLIKEPLEQLDECKNVKMNHAIEMLTSKWN